MTDSGFLVIMSGGADGDSERAGVGFLVAPWIRKSVVGFCQATLRMASLKIRIPGGKAVIFSAYAPHSGKPFDQRHTFFHDLADFVESRSAHGPKLILGDFNSKLYYRMDGEHAVVGDHVLLCPGAVCKEDANRHLLVETFTHLNMCLANTFFDIPMGDLATCYNVGTKAGSPVSGQTHSQIDFLGCEQTWLHNVRSVSARPEVPLSSHHFLIQASVHMEVDKCPAAEQVRRRDHSALADDGARQAFQKHLNEVWDDFEEAAPDNSNVNLAWCRLVDGFHHAEEKTLPSEPLRPRKPWISSSTLELIALRHNVRRDGDAVRERDIAKRIRISAARDKANWLENVTKDGDWAQIRRLRRGPQRAQGRLRTNDGELVDSDRRADALAQHLENLQWAVRPTTALPDSPVVHPGLPVNLGTITDEEVMWAARRLRNRRAGGLDGLPPEF